MKKNHLILYLIQIDELNLNLIKKFDQIELDDQMKHQKDIFEFFDCFDCFDFFYSKNDH